jgi:large subunit ribosomal protein L4
MDAPTGVPPLYRELAEKITVPVFDASGAQTGTIEVDPAEFGGKINRQLLHDVVLMYLANQRAGTHHTLRRGQVAGSTKKLFRQKGTGNARVGTKRSNKRRGGGTAKGPKPRDYEYHLPKKAVRAATRMAILSKLADGEALVVESLPLTGPKTKEMVKLLKAFKVGKKVVKKKNPDGTEQEQEVDVTLHDTTVLIGTAGLDLAVYKSGRNVEGVKVLPCAEFHAYIVLKQKRLLLTRAALDALRVATPVKRSAPTTADDRKAKRAKRTEAAAA